MRVLLALPWLTLLLLGAPAPGAATTLGVVAVDLGAEPQARVAKAAEAAAQDKGWTVELRDGRTAAGVAPKEQFWQAPDGLVLVMARADGVAAASGSLPVVSVLAGAGPRADFDLAINHYALGANIGAYLLGLVGYRGDLVMLGHESDPDARARARVLEVMLADAPEVRVVGQVRGGAGPGAAAALRRDLAALPLDQAGGRPLAVWAATDEMALVAEEVLRGRGYRRDRAAVVGIGGSREALARLRDPEGLLAATAAIPYELLGEAAVDLVDDLMAGTPKEQIATGPYVFIDPVLVDRSNVPAGDEPPW